MLPPCTRLLKNPRDRADASADDSEDVKETFVAEMVRVKDGKHQNPKAWEMLPACITERQESSEHVKWRCVLRRVSSGVVLEDWQTTSDGSALKASCWRTGRP